MKNCLIVPIHKWNRFLLTIVVCNLQCLVFKLDFTWLYGHPFCRWVFFLYRQCLFLWSYRPPTSHPRLIKMSLVFSSQMKRRTNVWWKVKPEYLGNYNPLLNAHQIVFWASLEPGLKAQPVFFMFHQAKQSPQLGLWVGSLPKLTKKLTELN